MKYFFKDKDGQFSMGRLLSFTLFFICVGMWIFIKATKGDLSNNDMTLIQTGWMTAIVGKAISKFGEKK